MSAKLFLCLVFICLTVPSQGQEISEEPDVFRNCVQISPLGIIGGAVAGNAERMFVPGQGLGIEGSYAFKGVNEGFAMGGFYRFYLGKTMRDNFFGVFARYFETESEMEIEDEKYPFKLNGSVVGAHFGGRWIHRKGFNFTWRIGYGYPMTEFYWGVPKSQLPEDASSIRKVVLFFSGLDAEASLGWAF